MRKGCKREGEKAYSEGCIPANAMKTKRCKHGEGQLLGRGVANLPLKLLLCTRSALWHSVMGLLRFMLAPPVASNTVPFGPAQVYTTTDVHTDTR